MNGTCAVGGIWTHASLKPSSRRRFPRLRYEDGSSEEVTVPWAERYSRLSKLMESFVIRVLQSCGTVKEAALLVGAWC